MSDDPASLYTVGAADPDGRLVDPSQFDADPTTREQVDRIMTAMGRLRAVERRLAEASEAYMRLKETDMRALHYLLVCENQGRHVTASDLARHLRITTASTTKLIDRLERGKHVVRHPHPSDRRALTVTVSPDSRAAAERSVGRHQASRVRAAADLTPDEREVVARFLDRTAEALATSLDAADRLD